jgi:hypothetical protein
MTPTPGRLLAQLMSQHDRLRSHIFECETLCDRLDAGEDVAVRLARAVQRLRLLFDAHNRFEEVLLRPVLAAADGFGDVRIDRMVDAHVAEHRELAVALAGEVAQPLRELLRVLRQHLAEEEKYFLTSRVLRDDVVTVEAGA